MQNDQRLSPRARHLKLDLDFPPLSNSLENVAVRVVVEDIGEADAPAPLLHRRDFSGLRVGQNGIAPTLEIDLPDLATAQLPAIRVHVARTVSSDIRPGDFINPQIVEVPSAAQKRCRIALIQVR